MSNLSHIKVVMLSIGKKKNIDSSEDVYDAPLSRCWNLLSRVLILSRVDMRNLARSSKPIVASTNNSDAVVIKVENVYSGRYFGTIGNSRQCFALISCMCPNLTKPSNANYWNVQCGCVPSLRA